MKILNESEIFSAESIARIEKMKHAKYVCETCLRGKGSGWVNMAVAIFWNKDPANIPAGGSAWFGLYYRVDPYLGVELDGDPQRQLMITNAFSATEKPIIGVVAVNGDVIYSRYRHDYRKSPDGTAMVDGGRDYLKTGPFGLGTVELQIVEGNLMIVGGLSER